MKNPSSKMWGPAAAVVRMELGAVVVGLLIAGLQCGAETVTIKAPVGGCESRSQREDFARQILAFLQKWEATVPHLKPEEEKWRRNEEKRLEVLRRSDMGAWVAQRKKFNENKEYYVAGFKDMLQRYEGSVSNILQRKYLEQPNGKLPDLECLEIRAWAELQSDFFTLGHVLYSHFWLLRQREKVPDCDVTVGLHSSSLEACLPTEAVGKAIGDLVLVPYLGALACKQAGDCRWQGAEGNGTKP